jgi:GWxTD domain-containing protein
VGYRAKLDPLSLTSPTPQAQPTAADDASASLPPAYRTWLNEEVLWIITPPERAAFLQLANNEERDRFIEDFWQRRNPVPGSPENSFREEHYARIAYANSHFASDKSAGWKTDRGRAYIVYGKPASIEAHPADSTPYEVWHYPSIPGLGSNIDLKFVDDDCNCNNYRLMSQTPPPASAQFSQAEKEYREFLATYPNSPEARKRLISIQAASQFAESSRYATFPNVALDLDNPDFQNRLAAAMNAVSRVNSPEFQKHLADARAAAVRLDAIDLQKQLAEASAASGNLRFLLQVEEGKTATNDPESAQRLIATVNSPKFQEQLAQAQVAVATAAAHIDTPEFRQRLDETINAATNLDLEFKAQDRLAQDANSLAQAEAQMPGSIAGKISDPSGAGIPHATVTAIDTDTGARTIRETDASGDSSISPLPPGPYNVDILAAGFKRTLQENVSVKPRQHVRVDLKLSAAPAGNAAITAAPPPPAHPHLQVRSRISARSQSRARAGRRHPVRAHLQDRERREA